MSDVDVLKTMFSAPPDCVHAEQGNTMLYTPFCIHSWPVLFFYQVWHQVPWFPPQYGHTVSGTEQKQPGSERRVGRVLLRGAGAHCTHVM